MSTFDQIKQLIFQALQTDKYSDKFLVQKKMYLLQESTNLFNYHYIWEINGPYSIDLSDDYIDLINTSFSLDDIKLKLYVKDNIALINSLKKEKPNDLNDLSWYQLLASLLYISKNKVSWKVTSKAEIISILLIYQKFTINQCYQAWNILTKYEFINNF